MGIVGCGERGSFAGGGHIDRLLPLAILEESCAGKKKQDPANLGMLHHFIVPMPYQGQVLQVRIMAKEFSAREQGARLYLVQAVEIKEVTPPSFKGDTATPEGNDAPHRPGGVEETFERMAALVKECPLPTFQSSGPKARAIGVRGIHRGLDGLRG